MGPAPSVAGGSPSGCRFPTSAQEDSMQLHRRDFLAGAGAMLALPHSARGAPSPSLLRELDRAAARPVLDKGAFTSPVIIDSIRLLKRDAEYFVHVRSKDGAEGISVT